MFRNRDLRSWATEERPESHASTTTLEPGGSLGEDTLVQNQMLRSQLAAEAHWQLQLRAY